MICSMCEQEMDLLPWLLIDTIPEHKNPDGTPHTQKICQECKESVIGMDETFDVSDELQKNPLSVERIVYSS